MFVLGAVAWLVVSGKGRGKRAGGGGRWSCGSLEASLGTSDVGDPWFLPVLECPSCPGLSVGLLYEGVGRGSTICRNLQLPGPAARVKRPVCPLIPHVCFCGPVSRPGKLQSSPLTAAGFSFCYLKRDPSTSGLGTLLCDQMALTGLVLRVPECLWFVTRHW